MVLMTDRDRDYAVRTILAEAQGEGPEGMAAVANVIRNRQASGHWGGTAADVVTAKHQFEPWAHAGTGKDNDPLRYSPAEDRYQQAARIWDAVQSGAYADPTKGATHFFAPKLQGELGRDAPEWSRTLKQTATLGGHAFYVDPSISGGAAITGKDKPMLDDSTGGMGSPGGSMPPPATPDLAARIEAALAQYGQPRQRQPNFLGKLLFGQGGLNGMMQQHMPNGLLGSLFGGGKPQAMPQSPDAGQPQQAPGAPMQLPGAMQQGGQPQQMGAPPPMLANAPMPNFGGGMMQPPVQDSAVRSNSSWANALSGFLGGQGMMG
jgi:hypothetical protein